MENNKDTKNEGKHNKNRNRKKGYWKRRNADRANRKRIEKAKNLRDELLRLQDHINNKYHSG